MGNSGSAISDGVEVSSWISGAHSDWGGDSGRERLGDLHCVRGRIFNGIATGDMVLGGGPDLSFRRRVRATLVLGTKLRSDFPSHRVAQTNVNA